MRLTWSGCRTVGVMEGILIGLALRVKTGSVEQMARSIRTVCRRACSVIDALIAFRVHTGLRVTVMVMIYD